LLGVKFRSCHGPSCFCHAKNVEAHDVAIDGSAFRTRPAIVFYLQKDHGKDKSFNSIYSIRSNSNDIINDNQNIGIHGYELNGSNDNQTHYMDKNKTDCLTGFVKDKAQTNRSCFC
jgi:hypothetical protein